MVALESGPNAILEIVPVMHAARSFLALPFGFLRLILSHGSLLPSPIPARI